MDHDEFEEKDDRQHSGLHSDLDWRWRTDSEADKRLSEMESVDSDESSASGRYDLAFILNSHPEPSPSPPPATRNTTTKHVASPHYIAAAAPLPLPQPPRRTSKHQVDKKVSRAGAFRSDVVRPASPPDAALSSTSQPAKRRPSTDNTSTDDRLAKKRGRTCRTEGCNNYIVHKGLCCRHGGGKKCSVEGCETSAKHKGLCWKHGGSVECKMSNCTKKAKAKGLCWAHGGGTKCTNPHCDKVAISNGCCWAHGGGKRCIYDGCNRPAYGRTNDFCTKHFAELQHVNYYEV